MAYRTGNHWGATIVWEGRGLMDPAGRRPDDKLIGWVPNDPDLAERIVNLLNKDDAEDDQEG